MAGASPTRRRRCRESSPSGEAGGLPQVVSLPRGGARKGFLQISVKPRQASDSQRLRGQRLRNLVSPAAPSLRIKLLSAPFHGRRLPRIEKREAAPGEERLVPSSRGWLDNACDHRVRRGSAYGGLHQRGRAPDGGPERGDASRVADFGRDGSRPCLLFRRVFPFLHRDPPVLFSGRFLIGRGFP